MLSRKLVKLLEELGDAAAQPVATVDTEPTVLTVSIGNDQVLPADEHKQVDEVKPVVVEAEEVKAAETPAAETPAVAGEEKVAEVSADAQPTVKISDDKIVVEIPAGDVEAVSDLEPGSDKEAEVMKESLRVIYGLLVPGALNESENGEVTAVVPEDAEAEVEVVHDGEDKKIVITIDAEHPKDTVTPAEAEDLQEALNALNFLVKKGGKKKVAKKAAPAAAKKSFSEYMKKK
jgi:hypothetical protein